MAHWHASAVRLPVGTVLAPQPDYEARWSAYGVGRILEDLRPEGMLAHREAVFMCEDPQDCDNAGANCDWLFEVEPHGGVQSHDMEWATRIDGLVSDGWPADSPEVVELARRYWSGEGSEYAVWEHLCASATILSVEEY
jgi:hypothetical protein